MKIKARYDVKMPAYALSYLVNGDDSGIEPEDKKAIDSYMAQYPAGAYVDVSDSESYFTWNPEFGLACDVVDCQIIVFEAG